MNKNKVLHAACILFISVLSNVLNAQWEQTSGPGGGSIYSLAVSGSGQIFAGTVQGGIFVSADNGTNWAPKGSDLPDDAIIWAVEVVDSQYVFAGTDSGVYLSTDNGNRWQQVNSGLGNTAVRAFARSGGYLLAGTHGGLFRSADHGATWVAAGAGLPAPAVSAFLVTGDSVFCGNGVVDICLSTDGGTNWTPVNSGIPTGIGVICLVKSGDNFLAGTWSGGAFISTDRGASWSAIDSSLANKKVRCFARAGNTVIAGTDGGIFLSDNDGISWRTANAGLSNRYVYSLAARADGKIYAGTNGGGVFRSSDGGANWSAVNAGLANTNASALAIDDEQNVYTGTNGPGIFRSSDNGTNWTEANTGLGNRAILSLTVVNRTLFAGTFGGIYVSANSGASWTSATYGLPNSPVNLLEQSGGVFFAVTGNRDLFRSLDGGIHWSAADSGITDTTGPVDLAMSGNRVFAGMYHGAVFMSVDNGASWSCACSSLVGNCVLQVLTADGDGNLFAGTQVDGMFRSVDNGKNWSAATSGCTDSNVVNIVAHGSRNLFAVTKNDGVFLSTNNGERWTSINQGLAAKVSHIVVGSSYLYAGTYYEGVWRRPHPQVVGAIDRKTPDRTALQPFFTLHDPGYTGAAVTVTFSLVRPEQVRGSVYDLSGQVVTSLVNKRLGAGAHCLTWNSGNVPVGCYMVRMQVNGSCCVKRVTVVR